MALLSFLSLKNQIAVSFIGVVVLLIYQVTLFDIKGDQISMIVNIFIIGILIFFILPSQFSLMSSIPRIERQSKGILRKEFHMKKKNKYVNNELGRIENSLDNLIEYVSSISILTQNSSSTISELSQKLIREINKTNEVMTHLTEKTNVITHNTANQSSKIKRIVETMETRLPEMKKLNVILNESTYKIQKIARSINMLGLNASIEASKINTSKEGIDVLSTKIQEFSKETKDLSVLLIDIVDKFEYILDTPLTILRDDARYINNSNSFNLNEVKEINSELSKHREYIESISNLNNLIQENTLEYSDYFKEYKIKN